MVPCRYLGECEMAAFDDQTARELSAMYRSSGVGRDWIEYIEKRYGVPVTCHECPVPLDRLLATQSEIELLKYRLVSEEGFRADEAIVVYKGRGGPYYVVDGHTRARVRWDAGDRTIEAFLVSSAEPAIELDLANAAARGGAGRSLPIGDVPIVDRLGEGSEAWAARRRELLRKTVTNE